MTPGQVKLFDVPNKSERLMLRELPEHEQPEHMLQWYGPTGCSNDDLLALAVHPKYADETKALIAKSGGLDRLSQMNAQELQALGLGPSIARCLVAMFELGRRAQTEARTPRQVSCPSDAAWFLMPRMSVLEQEVLTVVVVDTKHHILAVEDIYKGNATSAMVRTAEVFRPCIRLAGVGIIIAHNHPSGDPTPSPDDVVVTTQLVAAGKILDIEVLDHLIIGQNKFVSLKERGLGFN